jgi:hypothetical protein
MLMYPRGAANVQCAVCGVVSSAAQVWHVCAAPLHTSQLAAQLVQRLQLSSVVRQQLASLCDAITEELPCRGLQSPL